MIKLFSLYPVVGGFFNFNSTTLRTHCKTVQMYQWLAVWFIAVAFCSVHAKS